MALTAEQKRKAASFFVKKVFEEPNAVADLHLDNIVSGIESVETMFDSLASTLTQGATVKANIATSIGAGSASQKAILVAVTAMAIGGIFD